MQAVGFQVLNSVARRASVAFLPTALHLLPGQLRWTASPEAVSSDWLLQHQLSGLQLQQALLPQSLNFSLQLILSLLYPACPADPFFKHCSFHGLASYLNRLPVLFSFLNLRKSEWKGLILSFIILEILHRPPAIPAQTYELMNEALHAYTKAKRGYTFTCFHRGWSKARRMKCLSCREHKYVLITRCKLNIVFLSKTERTPVWSLGAKQAKTSALFSAQCVFELGHMWNSAKMRL